VPPLHCGPGAPLRGRTGARGNRSSARHPRAVACVLAGPASDSLGTARSRPGPGQLRAPGHGLLPNSRSASQCLSSVAHVATSRQPLAVAGEQLWPVPPLPVDGSTDTEPATMSDAVRLFAERARLVQHDFALDGRMAAIVTEVCRRLDGIPLAIELAAARVRVLGLEELAARLDERLRLFSTESRGVPIRQRTLRAALDWSYDLLNETEQALFRRLSVFAGGWTMTAETIWRSADEIQSHHVLDVLARLVDRSLVQVQPVADGGVRYSHSRRFANMPWSNSKQAARSRRYVNARAALQWSIDSGDGHNALTLGAALGRFWLLTGRYREGQLLGYTPARAGVCRRANTGSSETAAGERQSVGLSG
jgi:predicted ATPase